MACYTSPLLFDLLRVTPTPLLCCTLDCKARGMREVLPGTHYLHQRKSGIQACLARGSRTGSIVNFAGYLEKGAEAGVQGQGSSKGDTCFLLQTHHVQTAQGQGRARTTEVVQAQPAHGRALREYGSNGPDDER